MLQLRVTLPCLLLFLAQLAQAQSKVDIRYVEPSETTGSSAAVIVGTTALAHTSLIQPVDERGKVVGYEQPAIQTERTLDNLELVLAEAHTDLDSVVKLNVYVKDQQAVQDVNRILARRFGGKRKPAVTFAQGELALAGSYVAMDAVATTAFGMGQKTVERFATTKLTGNYSGSHVAIMPDGVQVYVSGQAEGGNTGNIREAATATMQSLFKTLEFLGLDKSHVVQVKAFMTPISSQREVETEIIKAFQTTKAPPVTFVEWTMQAPVEIELIAFGGDQGHKARESVEYLTPPEVKPSPVYSRVARINYGKTIYVSGLTSVDDSAEVQIKDIFATIKYLVGGAGSDMLHLVKATYYVTDDNTSTRLNDLRPTYYDAKRPPAASKAMIRGVGKTGRTVAVDMIAVTK